MALVNKPDESIFASSAKQGEVDNFPDLLRGWGITFDQTQGIPPMEWFNFLFKRLDEKHAYLMQRGLPEWSATQDYTKGSCVQFDGVSYRALKNSKNNRPNESNSQYWVRWGFALSEIARATLQQPGIVQLSSSTNSESESEAATSKAVKIAHELAESKQSPATTLAGYGINNFKVENGSGNMNNYRTDGIYCFGTVYGVSNSPRDTNSDVWSGNLQVITGGIGNERWCRQIFHVHYSKDTYIRWQVSNTNDDWSAWEKLNTDGIPVGAVVSFPRAVTNPVGFLKANGTTFNQQTFPDLYQVLGNSNQLPDLTRSDVGMTAYFAVDNIPNGWIAFDEIVTQVTEQRYPELYRHLVGKYGSINSVPKVADRFLRNAGNGLSVGQTQEDAIRNITGKFGPVDGGGRHTGAFRQEESFGYGATLGDSRWWVSFDASRVVPVANENRPKSLILKLCIKAINSFDDVVFWIKSHGEVTNAGALDAGRLAQGLQDKADRNHTHTASQITDFNQATSQIINAAITYQKIGDFEIRKYPDGTMIQSCRVNIPITNRTIIARTLNWALAFADADLRMSATIIYKETNESYRTQALQGNIDTANATASVIQESASEFTLVIYDSDVNNAAFFVDIIAIGKWK